MSNLLPPNATETNVNLDESLSRIESVPTPARTLIDPDNAPVQTLPWLAWAQSVDNWDINWTEAQRRAVIKAAYAVHRQKGTVYALRRALEALGYELIVQEWYQQVPVGEPYTFDVIIKNEGSEISADKFKELFSVIEANKNLRSHLSKVKLIVNSEARMYTVSNVSSGNELDYDIPASGLALDGSWSLDGSYKLNGFKAGN